MLNVYRQTGLILTWTLSFTGLTKISEFIKQREVGCTESNRIKSFSFLANRPSLQITLSQFLLVSDCSKRFSLLMFVLPFTQA